MKALESIECYLESMSRLVDVARFFGWGTSRITMAFTAENSMFRVNRFPERRFNERIQISLRSSGALTIENPTSTTTRYHYRLPTIT